MSALPKTVLVGPHEYRVEVVRGLKNDDGEALNGSCDLDSLQIKLDSRIPFSKKQECLWHEVNHAAASLAGIAGKTVDEEGWVDPISHVQLQVIQQNPGLVQFLISSEPPRKSPRKKAPKAVPDNPGAGRPDVREAGQQVQDMRSQAEKSTP